MTQSRRSMDFGVIRRCHSPRKISQNTNCADFDKAWLNLKYSQEIPFHNFVRELQLLGHLLLDILLRENGVLQPGWNTHSNCLRTWDTFWWWHNASWDSCGDNWDLVLGSNFSWPLRHLNFCIVLWVRPSKEVREILTKISVNLKVFIWTAMF